MKRAIVVLLLLIANAVFGSSTTRVPDTAPGTLLQEWLAAVNAADADGLRKFAETRYTSEAREGRSASEIAEAQLENRESNGGYDVFKVEQSTPTDLTVVLKSRGTFPRFSRLGFKVADATSSVLTERNGVAIGLPEEEKATRKPAAALAEEIDRKLNDLARKDEFSGTALIAKHGKPIWQKAYGMQDREKKIPVELDTKFRLGSMNKMFTAVAIAQLVEAGKLKLDDTLGTLLPDYPNKDAAAKITVAQLLNHTAGLGDIFTPGFDAKRDSLRELKDYLPLFVDEPLRFEPGTRQSYSNAGFVVLGLIVEKISGQSYYDYVEKNIYAPAGMTATTSLPRSEKQPKLAVGYMRGRDGKLVANDHTLPLRGMSAGGGESTVGDLMHFARALRTHKLLSPETTDLFTTAKAGAGKPGPLSSYAFGMIDRRAGDRRIVGHGGGAPGMNADLGILWNEGYTVVVLANRDPNIAQDISSYISDRLL